MSITNKSNMDKKEIQATTISKDGKLTAIASTEDKDRSGDVLSVHNWDFSKFKMNPVLQAGHDYRPQYTIGKAENLRVENKQVLFDPVFHDITPLAKQVKEMYEQGFLNAWSVGFIPGTAQLKGEDGGTQNELLEVSAVAVPANAFALMKGFEAEHTEEDLENEIKGWLGETEEKEIETKETAEQTTSETDGHTHVATFDEETGDGTTSEAEDHTHVVSNFELEEVNDHTHVLETTTDPEELSVVEEPKKEKKIEPIERWNKSLPAVFDQKRFEIEDVGTGPTSFNNEILSKYLECEVKDIFENSFEIPSPLIPSYLAGFKEILSDYELKDTRSWSDWNGIEQPPQYSVVQLNSEKSDDFLVEGTQFYEFHSDGRAAVKFYPTWYSLGVNITTNSNKKDWNKNLLEKVHQWVKENNYLKGEKFSLSGEFIPASEKTWDDIILDDNNKKAVQKALKNVDTADKKSRGLLFVGPPGTGKTMTGKIMKDQAESTFLWVSSTDMYKIGAIGALKLSFKLARDLAPTVLFIEDIDAWLKDGSMDLLKTEMDGIRENKGLITVLTSNEPENFPDALLDRPGRFHEVLNFDVPTKELRTEMINRWIGEIDEKILEDVLEKTEGYSGAYMKELVEYAHAVAEDEELSLTDALVRSLEKLTQQRELIQQIRQTNKSYDNIVEKEGRVISTKNRKIINEAKDALEKILDVDKKEEIDDEEVKGMSDFTPQPKAVVEKAQSKQLSQGDVLLKTLQSVSKIANQGLHDRKKV